jgi:hypothetical protein
MTSSEFNNKYKKYLEPRHYGLDINNPELIDWLDSKFQNFITYPNFKYFQIKLKFNYGVFYCQGLPQAEITEVQNKITELYDAGRNT